MTDHSLVSLEGEDIVIRITPEGLRHATEQGVLCTFWVMKKDFRKVQVVDMEKWRASMIRALTRETDNGDCPVMVMLDECLEWAADQGEEGIEIEGIIR